MPDPAIHEDKLLDERVSVARLLARPAYDEAAARRIRERAGAWVEALRAETDAHTLLDTFLAEYGLSNEEGVALMCLAEAFLRIPDDETAELLVVDKLAERDWSSHLGRADSWLVNSSTWALMLTGKTLRIPASSDPGDWLSGLISKLGRPVVQAAIRAAMQILGKEFVLGETIDGALKRSTDDAHTAYSYDMLGEGARDRASAERYTEQYARAIDAVARSRAASRRNDSVSIKLSALHPRYEPLKWDVVGEELFQTLLKLCRAARERDVPVSIDAEEADRLQMSLELFERLVRALDAWQGLGIVVQAYGKRAPAIVEWLVDLARAQRTRIPVRLVKGAYWDAEIKHAQVLGLEGFPVYTRKATTDAAYLNCARRLLDEKRWLFPQFATHNAHTVAAVIEMAGDAAVDGALEFQRLHGMGEHLYEVARRTHPGLPVRIYAPVGHHSELLAYLVRRLLENGANSSFVNRIQNDELSLDDVLQDPFDVVRGFSEPSHPRIRTPRKLYGEQRENSLGLDFSDRQAVAALWPERAALEPVQIVSSTSQSASESSSPRAHVSPTDGAFVLGWIHEFDPAACDAAFAAAQQAQPGWDALGGAVRGARLEAFADLLHAHRAELFELLCYEAGKTLEDAVNEVREAVDFCRYYAAQARRAFTDPVLLPGPTGESNELSLHGRGVVVCISPWNFPLSIFVGQLSAALLAGNAVLAKPAETTPRIAAFAFELLARAGIEPPVCQLLLGGAKLGQALVGHALCAGVAFTGSFGVAQLINRQLAARNGPICPLIAETGGQNALLVDSTALLEQVTDDVVHSAFGSAGQRCSALRLLCLQEDIADDALTLIRGAMNELSIDHPRLESTDLGPIITEQAMRVLSDYISGCEQRGLTVYRPPLQLPANGNYLAPCMIELEAFGQLGEEQFGPVLHVLRFASGGIDALMAQIADSGYGLTFGVHTRLQDRARRLAMRSPAGNVYVNRSLTGAVVGTQPFGGQGLSGTGPKAGGPHYLTRFALEKTVTINTMANGGNLDLLASE